MIIDMLTAIDRFGRTTLSDLALILDIPTATAHRVLKTLEKLEFVSFDKDTQDWMVGIEAYRTGTAFLNQSNLTAVGLSLIPGIMRETGETANHAIPDKFEVVFVGQFETQNPIRTIFPAGTRSSMHASGAGKAILSALLPQQVAKLQVSAGLQQFTARTLTTPRALQAELEQMRTRGWSFDREERYRGISCIGSAIYDPNGQPIEAVSISGPSTRFIEDRIATFGAAVAQAAAEITRKTGGRAPNT